MQFLAEKKLQQAVEAHRAGELQKAESLYRAILQDQPNHPDANHNLGVLTASLNKFELALPLFKTALEANPKQGQFWISYIEALISSNLLDIAKGVIEQGKKLGLAGERIDYLETQLLRLHVGSLDKEPKTDKLFAAKELRETGRYQEAIEWLNNFLEIQGSDPEAWSLLSQIYMLQNEDIKAERALSTAVSINTNLPSIYRNRARLLLKKSKIVEALLMAQSGYERSIEEPESWVVLASCLGANQRDAEALPLIERALLIRSNYAEAFASRAFIRIRAKNITGAIDDLETATCLKPHLSQLWGLLGSLHYQNANLLSAIETLKKAHILEPTNVSYMIELGEFLRRDNKALEAISILEEAARKAPENTSVWTNLGAALQQDERIDSAKMAYEKALALNPKSAEILNNLGVLAKDTGDWESACQHFQKAIELKPENAVATHSLGMTQQVLGRLTEAEASYNKAIELKPELAEAHYSLGNFVKELGRLEEAEISYNKAITLNPEYSEAHYNLGITLQLLGRFEEAETSYKKAIALKPDIAEGYSNLGITLQELGRLEEAVANYRKAIELNPKLAEAYYNLGITLQELGLQEAETSYRKAIELKPDLAEAHSNLAQILTLQSKYLDAMESANRALTIDENMPSALQTCSTLLAYMSDFSNVCKFSDDALCHSLKTLSFDKQSMMWECRLYPLIYHPDLSSVQICKEYINWGNRFSHLGQGRFPAHNRTIGRKLRVGYVSPDFRGHTCRFYFEPLFANHNHYDFEIFAYSNVRTEDEHTQRMKPYFDGWRDIVDVPDQGVAQMIKDDQIDILVDGCGHMKDTRLTVFAHKPAPIQVTWLGSAWTTGLPQMDYVLFDPHMAPDDAVASEQIIRLPRTWTAFRPGIKAQNTPVKLTPAAIDNGYITFGYSGRTERLNHRVFRVWGRILNRLPSARLIMDYKPFSDPKTRAYFQNFLQGHGIDIHRVTFRYSENVFEALNEIDILLDSFPHSGGTMLFDAVWMGVPVVTLASDRPVGRIGTSLMTNLGLSDWVAQDEQEYEDKAVNFAQNIPALVNLRASMRDRMKSSPIMDEAAFARDVEHAFKAMWQTWINDEKNSVAIEEG